MGIEPILCRRSNSGSQRKYDKVFKTVYKKLDTIERREEAIYFVDRILAYVKYIASHAVEKEEVEFIL
nr:hypothetical protein [Brevibacillus laterosporus]